eukprot:Nitzschia sp. Nitz4//scaffold43_size134323//114064//116656//NITZ4_003319-RA/size134323-snap-gene-0.91-mRNA-1//-1//CDS//3329552008//4472//frame0
MYAPTENSGLLNGGVTQTQSRNTGNGGWAARSFLAFVGFVVVMAIVSGPNDTPSNMRGHSSLESNDPSGFDERYHAWETSMYSRTMLVDLEGMSPEKKLEKLQKKELKKEKKAQKKAEKEKKKEEKKALKANATEELVYLNTSTATKFFLATKPTLTQHFYYYQQGWEAQINQAYCAVASTMAALNSLRGKITLPQDPVYSPYPWATQKALMKNQCVKDTIYDIDTTDNEFWGLGLDMAADFINCFLSDQGFNATAYHINPVNDTAGEIRSIFLGALGDADTRILINYDRGALGQGPLGHGHFSPIGAYSFPNDSFLVMDVAKYKYPAAWVPSSMLLDAMGSIDTCAVSDYSQPLNFSDPDLSDEMGCQPAFRGYILIQNVTLSGTIKPKTSFLLFNMYGPTEDSGLLNRGVSRLPRKNPRTSESWVARSFLVFVGVVVVAIFSAPNGNPSNVRGQSSIDPNSPASFDERYHAWEASMYRRTLEVDLEGSSPGTKLEQLESKKLEEEQKEDTIDEKENEKGIKANITQDLVYLNSSTATKFFLATKPTLTQHFYYYQQGWEAQINQAYCAVASTMAALNSLRGKITLPQDPVYSPYPWATQKALMKNQCVKDTIYDIDTTDNEFWGLGLDMAADFINCFLSDQGFNATAYHINPVNDTAGEIRSIFLGALGDADTRILINYDRGALGQGPLGHGHFSPIGAYSFHKDSFLVMDVAKYKYPAVWVPTSTLMHGIGSIDACAISESSQGEMRCQPAYRGYILIQNRTK